MNDLFTKSIIDNIQAIIDECGKYYNQSEQAISKEKRYFIEKNIPNYINIYFTEGINGLLENWNKYLNNSKIGLEKIRNSVGEYPGNFKQIETDKDYFILGIHYKIYEFLIKQFQNKTTVIAGFQSSLTDKQIKSLYKQMIDTYIDSTPENFEAIFKDEILPLGFSIKWKKSKVLLAYFIKKLFHSDNYLNVWVKAEKIFNVKDLQNSECNNPHPKGYEKIDSILENIYTHLQ